MRRTLLRLSALLLLLACVPAWAAPPVPLLWKVSDHDSALYLLGSFHMLARDDYPLAPEVEEAFAGAGTLVFELDPEEAASPALAMRMVQAARRTRPGSLREDLGPELWARLERQVAAGALPAGWSEQFEPWFIALTLQLAGLARQGLDPGLGLDRHFMRAAAAAGKPASGLEPASAQIALMAGMDLDEQRQMLAEVLDLLESGPARLDRLHGMWRAGDAQGLWEGIAVRMQRDYPALYARINVARNDAWLPVLERHLAGRDDVLVVVGSLHLLGPDGLVEKLRARGYRVERICRACAR
ncbi:TraB/GumN family protein [Pseudoxanthomonas taiwanensis]|uniref:TraB/GumN family protein n=1 Tax=Pseudoxanthomonas taiwanensis TaxID=176598 RepID=A0A921P008_9GAMM|nr:TraB/GumN family protein [Pseudoxanthomonas taiwanensis]KAF1688982.1 hypothetical protein CR938_07620 [Pseudoxanthomonas taiwanensis]